MRVRYAPSPTGHLHIGGARTALFNYLFARKHGGAFIVRIEDTDRKRHVEGAEGDQLEQLRWLGLSWDESIDVGGPYGPYRASERLSIYRAHIEELLERDLAYPCFCDDATLEAKREAARSRGEVPRYDGTCARLTPKERRARLASGEPHAVRLRVPAEERIAFSDLVRGEVVFRSADLDDFVLMKQDGMPTYNFAVVVDDHLMRISHVIRGEEHLSNTPKQLLVYRAYGWTPPSFAHLPLILNEARQKMSKRDETLEQFVEQYRALGVLPEALVNFLALLGWAPEEERELFTLPELIERFSLERVSKSPAVFDRAKLRWMNQMYYKARSSEDLARLALPHAVRAGWLPEVPDEATWRRFVAVVDLVRGELGTAREIIDAAARFYRQDDDVLDVQALEAEARSLLIAPESRAVLSAFVRAMDARGGEGEFVPEDVRALFQAVRAETGQKGRALFMPVRLAATGEAHGPELDRTLSLLGPARVRRRLVLALERLEQWTQNQYNETDRENHRA